LTRRRFGENVKMTVLPLDSQKLGGGGGGGVLGGGGGVVCLGGVGCKKFICNALPLREKEGKTVTTLNYLL